jgi:hypothetical protein
MAEENNLISVSGTVNDTIYAKGDTCLLINPFDTYHLFRIYNNWNTDSKSLLNLSDSGQKIFLIFKSNKTEIRIPEFDNSGSTYSVDRTNGEVLFKITKENANNILAMSSNTFYLTRLFEYYDGDGKLIYTSGEEVIFTGKWADESRWSSSSLTAMIESLKKQLESANSQINSLTRTVNEQRLQLESYIEENQVLQERNAALESENEEIQRELSVYESANEFTSVVISDNATYQYYKGDTEVDSKGNIISKKEFVKDMNESQLLQKLENSQLNNKFKIDSRPQIVFNNDGVVQKNSKIRKKK